MAAPGTAARFLAALKAEGLTVREHDGWKTHNRNHKGAWGPLHGVMVHHTGGGESGSSGILYNGIEGLPGPLCHGGIHKDGVVELIGWGRANHAGGGDPDVLAAVKAETYPLPKTDKHDGEPGSVDGNAHFIGYECINKGDGRDPWPPIQLEAIARAVAAVCRLYGWNVNSTLRHMDWSDWKPDPKGVDWTKMRARITAILAGPPNATPMSNWVDGDADGAPGKPIPVPTTPAPSKPKPLPVVSVANVIDAYRRDRPARQGATSHPADVKLVEAALDKLNFLDPRYAKDGSFGTTTEDAFNRFRRSIGLRGDDATGAPGRYSLGVLGSRSGLFTIK
ncbi:endolysin [Streptomyces phage Xkcd426]|nr:endolysin [Streptomyces phage Xkcd426]